MAEQYVTKTDLEDFKKELLAEMKKEEISLKEKDSGHMFLRPVYQKWFYNQGTTKPFDTPFIGYLDSRCAHRLWEGIRKVVCSSVGVNNVAQIHRSKREFALDFSDKLCEFIFEYVKQSKEGAENG